LRLYDQLTDPDPEHTQRVMDALIHANDRRAATKGGVHADTRVLSEGVLRRVLLENGTHRVELALHPWSALRTGSAKWTVSINGETLPLRVDGDLLASAPMPNARLLQDTELQFHRDGVRVDLGNSDAEPVYDADFSLRLPE
jgi:hypothetical protein